MRTLLLRCVVAALLTSSGALADAVLSVSPASLQKTLAIADLALDEGAGDATLSGALEGVPFAIYFYDCDGAGFTAPAAVDSKCRGFEYRAYFEGYPSDGETVNAWNDAHHYGALWRDEAGDLALQLNVIVEGGVTEANLRATYRWWGEVLKSFQIFVGDR
ncbi:MAG: YbjN domain-containing protein [Pseudomonadota bacterium]